MNSIDNVTLEDLKKEISSLLASKKEREARKKLATLLTDGVELDKIIPANFSAFRRLVRDGLEFFLQHHPLEVLIDTCRHLVQSCGSAPTREELSYLLAGRFPTLQKLCQTIARNEHLDPAVKEWLVQLESCHDNSLDRALEKQLEKELLKTGRGEEIVPGKIIAQASVAAVISCTWRENHNKVATPFVIKLLKPGISKTLARELDVLSELASYLEVNKDKYGLGQLRVSQLFYDLRNIFAAEVNLTSERYYLQLAGKRFKDIDNVHIPKIGDLSTEKMTTLEFMPGEKVTDAHLSRSHGKRAAEILCDTLICGVIFSNEKDSIFHGDPHAGNIQAHLDDNGEAVQLSLLDWSLAGTLDLKERITLVRLIVAIATNSHTAISNSINELAVDQKHLQDTQTQDWKEIITGLCRKKEFTQSSLVRKSLWLVGELSFAGATFSAELLLFRKAIYTLEGVLKDLDPNFDLDTRVMNYLARLLWQESPERIMRSALFTADKAENYPSLISTQELQFLGQSLYMQLAQKIWDPLFCPWQGLQN